MLLPFSQANTKLLLVFFRFYLLLKDSSFFQVGKRKEFCLVLRHLLLLLAGKALFEILSNYEHTEFLRFYFAHYLLLPGTDFLTMHNTHSF